MVELMKANCRQCGGEHFGEIDTEDAHKILNQINFNPFLFLSVAYARLGKMNPKYVIAPEPSKS
jgi:hypothetical protein